MVDKRKSLASDLGISIEDASRILIEKEKVLLQSELKYHIKSVCGILDKIKRGDVDFSDQCVRDSIKFLLARHGSIETMEEICDYIEGLSESFFEKELSDRLRDDF